MDKQFVVKKLTVLFFCLFIYSCASTNQIKTADSYADKSRDFFEKAIKEYTLALKSKDSKDLRMRLADLYYQNGRYQEAIEYFKGLDTKDSKRMLALSYYKSGDYTDALSVFNSLGKDLDDEYLYYYGLTCEKQNLFDQALAIYASVKSANYKDLAQKRVGSIESGALDYLQEDVKKLLSIPISQDKYPQAGAVVLDADEVIQVFPNDTSISTGHYAIKILNERGKNEFSEITVGYDSTFEKVDLEFARTISPDGKVTYAGKRHIRDVSRYLEFPLYSNARVLIVSMPDVSYGCIIEYKVKTTNSHLINKKDFDTIYALQDNEPVLSSRFKLIMPFDRLLNQKILNEKYNSFGARLEPEVSEEKENSIYSWEFKDTPKILPEPSMPSVADIDTMIVLSTFKSWADIYNWWWELAKDKIEVTPELQKKADELTKGKITQEDKIRSIYNYVAQKIRYVAVEYGQAGYEPHKASLVFANKYGDCKDKAILLVTMFKAAGIKSYPVLIGTKDTPRLQEDFPALIFNHCITIVDMDGELIFLDPTAETTSFGDLPVMDQDRQVLVFFSGGHKIMKTPKLPASRNRVLYNIDIKINPDETIKGDRRVETSGVFDATQKSWIKDTMPIMIEESLKQKVREISPDGKLLDYKIQNADDLDKTVRLNFSFSGRGFLSSSGKARVIPPLGGSFDTSVVSREERVYPIEFSFLENRQTNIRIELPTNLKVKYLPDRIVYKTAWLDFKREYVSDKGAIIFKETRTLKQTDIPLSQYQDFKKFCEALARKMQQVAILEKTQVDEK